MTRRTHLTQTPAPATRPVPATPATPTPTPRVRLEFDTYNCSRCGGTGFYSRGRCFLCGGAKVRLTPAGRRAYAKWRAWRDEHLTMTPEEAASSGTPVIVPQEFAGPQDGGTYIRFRRPRRVLAVRRPGPDAPPTQMVEVDIDLRLKYSPSPWLRYDAERGVLTISVMPDHRFYRQATGAELRAAFPTLGKGVRLVELPEPAA